MFNTPEEIFYSVIAGVVLMIFVGIIFILTIVRYQGRLYKQEQEQQNLKDTFAKTILQAQIEIQEQTRQHISQELHDNLGQIASLIKINLNTMQLGDTDKTAEKLLITKDLTRQLIADIKSLSVGLNSERITQFGLVSALATETERLNKTGVFKAIFTHEEISEELNTDTAIIIFRMAQEVLNNMVKHSEASLITIKMSDTKKTFTLALSDNGVGYNVDEKMNNGGAGLHNLLQRAALIQAQISIKSQPGEGSQVIIQIPF